MMKASASKPICGKLAIVVFLAGAICVTAVQAAPIDGRKLLMDPRKGNCMSCHHVPGAGVATGHATVGPELVEIKTRYPDQSQLRAAIWDLSTKLPKTVMPPYGRHRILTDTEIDAVVQYLETL